MEDIQQRKMKYKIKISRKQKSWNSVNHFGNKQLQIKFNLLQINSKRKT